MFVIVVRCYTPAVSRQLVFASTYGFLPDELNGVGFVCTNYAGGSHANIAGYHTQVSKTNFWHEAFKPMGAVVDSFIFPKLNECAC